MACMPRLYTLYTHVLPTHTTNGTTQEKANTQRMQVKTKVPCSGSIAQQTGQNSACLETRSFVLCSYTGVDTIWFLFDNALRTSSSCVSMLVWFAFICS